MFMRSQPFLRNQRGSSGMLFAIGLPLSMGGAALAVDSGQWILASQKSKQIADLAVLASAYAVGAGDVAAPGNSDPNGTKTGSKRSAALTAMATREAQRNGFDAAAGDTLDIEYFPAASSLEVTVRRSANSWFARVFGVGSVQVSGQSTATLAGAPPACVLALSAATNPGILVQNMGVIDAGCGIQSNSTAVNSNMWTADGAIYLNSGTLRGTSINATGTFGQSNSGANTLSPTPMNNQPSLADSYAALLPAGSFTGACQPAVYNSGTYTLNPGNYCNGLTIQNGGTATLASGVYEISGDFNIAGGATVNASGPVTFVLRNGKIRWDNGTFVGPFAAPQSGIWSGVLIKQESGPAGGCTLASGGHNAWAGGNISTLDGLIYLAGCDLRLDNNARLKNANTAFGILVARSIQVEGSARIELNLNNRYGIGNTAAGSSTPRLRKEMPA